MAIEVSSVNTATVAPSATTAELASALTSAIQAGDLPLGTVIAARVLAVLDNGAVQLAVGNALLAATSQVPLTPGATIQLAVQATDNGTTLRLIGQTPTPGVPPSAVVAVPVPAAAATAAAPTVAEESAPAAAPPVAPTTAVATNAGVATTQLGLSELAPTASPALAPALAADATAALTAAVRSAAVTQNSQAPLFAEAAAAVELPALPEPVRQQAIQLLALRPQLDANLSGADIRQAFAQSGLFFEAQLAEVSAPAASDFAVATNAGAGSARPNTAPSAAAPSGAGLIDIAATSGMPVNDLKAALIVLRQVLSAALAENDVAPLAATATSVATLTEPGLIAAGTPGLSAETAARGMPASATVPGALTSGALPSPPPPPPPFRGALPTAQPPASPTITAATPPQEAAKVLMNATDAALSRQTLLQAASLPGQSTGAAGSTGTRVDPGGPRWNFEVPFATPQGTHIAQFEISRDGKPSPRADAVKPVWRARFSIDVDPLGPVHAQVSLAGSRTNVALWAERPEGAARLREGAAALGDALRGAQLDAGDLVVRDGAPRRSGSPMPAGHFLDRAS